MRYHQYRLTRETRDRKILIRSLAQYPKSINVGAGSNITSAEVDILIEAGLGHPTSVSGTVWLEAAHRRLLTAGYTIDTRCHHYIDWVSDDGYWRLRRMADGWRIRYHTEGSFDGVIIREQGVEDEQLFPTRDAAIHWATNECKHDVYGNLWRKRKS